MTTELQFEKIIKGYPEEVQILARATRDKIYTILPEVTEIIWEKQKTSGYGTGPKKMSEHFSWILLSKNHVTLGFNYGTELPDPGQILEGTGEKFRHYKVKSMADLENKELTALMIFSTTHRVPPI